MSTPSHAGSIRCAALLRRYTREKAARDRLATARQNFLDSITVVKPAEVPEDEWEAPSVYGLLMQRDVQFKFRTGGKFASAKNLRETLVEYNDPINEHSAVMKDCREQLLSHLGPDDLSDALKRWNLEAAAE